MLSTPSSAFSPGQAVEPVEMGVRVCGCSSGSHTGALREECAEVMWEKARRSRYKAARASACSAEWPAGPVPLILGGQ